MPRIGEYISGFDELTPTEKSELLGDAIEGFKDLTPDEQKELVDGLAAGERKAAEVAALESAAMEANARAEEADRAMMEGRT